MVGPEGILSPHEGLARTTAQSLKALAGLAGLAPYVGRVVRPLLKLIARANVDLVLEVIFSLRLAALSQVYFSY